MATELAAMTPEEIKQLAEETVRKSLSQYVGEPAVKETVTAITEAALRDAAAQVPPETFLNLTLQEPVKYITCTFVLDAPPDDWNDWPLGGPHAD